MLATDLYRNADGGTAPVLVMRLPYDKERSVTPELMTLVQAGYHVVVQDTRGRFASQGEFHATHQETTDGADCYAWVAQQPWCAGQIGTLGQSYLGQVQWLAAPQMPAAVKAMDVLAAIAHGADVDPAHYYMRTTPTFETGAPCYDWLNDLIAVGSGLRRANAVVLDFYRVC